MRLPRTEIIVILASLTVQFAMAQVRPSVAGPAPNAWMKTPTEKSAPDSVAPSVRSLRDQYFDSINISSREPLTPENAGQHAISEGSFIGAQPEILELPNRAVLIGTFASSRSVLNASGRAVYTEVTVHVGETFEDPAGGTHHGADVTVALPGGTVGMPGGKNISYLTQPRSFFIEPGKTYLFVLGYHASGDFYMLGKDWDLSNGVVRANSGLDMKRQKEGTSSLVGLTRSQLVQLLNKRFLVNQ